MHTYEAYKGCGHFYLLQVIDIFHSLCQDQAEEETHTDHLSTRGTKTIWLIQNGCYNERDIIQIE